MSAEPDTHHEAGKSPLAWFSLLLLVIVVITLYEVVARYIFGRPTVWANELSLFLSAIVFLVSGVYAMQRDEHLRISVIHDIVPRPVRRVFDAIALLCTLVFCGGLAWFGFPTAWRALVTWERFGTAWNPPIPAVIKPLIVVVAAAMALVAIVNFVRNGRRHPPVEDERIT
jgi:TRAP-type C4-dicarboxylate transport system permease small subunit